MRYAQTWNLRRIGTEEWFPARVPGNIQYDYAVSHGFGDIHYGMNHLKFLEIEDWEWEYQTAVSVKPQAGERVFFVSYGIDYFFDIAVNGKTLYSHEGMFTVTELDITDALTGDGDVLSVFVRRHPKRPGEPASRNQAVDSCKPAVSYTWDYHPRILPSGIWDETYIETRAAGFIRSAECTYTLNEDRTAAAVRFLADCDEQVQITLTDDRGTVVYQGTEKEFTLENPRLWWCNGQGEPTLYTWSVKSSSDEKTGKVGFRTVELQMNEGAWSEPAGFPKGRSDCPVTVTLNGRRIFAAGSNWVLPDMFPGNLDAERTEKHVRLVHDAHMNILRCHGGSGIGKDAFYDACDRLGIMVWVEFPLACNNYVATPHYLKLLEQEATAIIRRLRPHVSVTIWCGGNELFNSWSRMTDQSLPLRLLNKLTYELSPERPFLMTSPVAGMGHGGYTFWNDEKNCDCFALFQNSRKTAYSEFGVPGVHSADYLRSIIPADVIFPPKEGEENWTAHHAFGAWGQKRWLCLDVLARYWNIMNLEELAYCSQWLQCEGYKAIFEEARRQSPHCSMALNWCFSEPWKTAANNSLVSFPTEPKQAYYAVKSSLRPTLFSARIPKFDWQSGEVFRAELWLLNMSPAAVSGTVEVEIEMDGKIYPQFSWNASASANRNTIGPAVNFTLPASRDGVLILRLKAGEYSSEYKLVVKTYTKVVHRVLEMNRD